MAITSADRPTHGRGAWVSGFDSADSTRQPKAWAGEWPTSLPVSPLPGAFRSAGKGGGGHGHGARGLRRLRILLPDGPVGSAVSGDPLRCNGRRLISSQGRSGLSTGGDVANGLGSIGWDVAAGLQRGVMIILGMSSLAFFVARFWGLGLAAPL